MTSMAMELPRVVAAVAALGGSSAEFAGLSDAEVLAARAPIAALLRLSNTVAALLAGTIAERSRRQLGQSGLAARHGFGTPTLMVQHATGLSRIEAGRLLAVGVLMSETETAEREAAAAREAAREAARVAEAAADAAAQAAAAAAVEAAAEAQRAFAWEAAQWEAREADRAAAWAELYPGLPLPKGQPRPVPVIAVPPVTPALPLAAPVVVPVVVVPWQAPIMHAVAAGIFSPGVGDALLRGLGTVDQAVTAEKLAAALRVVLVEAPGLNTEQAFKRARRLRDELDVAGILAREKQARDDTSWSLWRRADGMVTVHALLPPEQGELWIATYDALTSPRRGGVRFVDPERALWAQSVRDDPRTVDQIAADSFTQLLKLGAEADPNTLFGGRRPVVQVIVTDYDRPTTIPAPAGQAVPAPEADSRSTALTPSKAVEPTATNTVQPVEGIEAVGTTGMTEIVETIGTTGTTEAGEVTGIADRSAATRAPSTGTAQTAGQATPSTRPSPEVSRTGVFGYIEGNPAPVSEETIARHLCDTGYLGILFSQTGQPLNVGRDARLFNREQRRALAARDGGCRWPGCDEPPSWSEAHHVENWADLGFPTSTRPYCSVFYITCCCTTGTGRSCSSTESIGYSPPSTLTRSRR
ncbi:HNH endonuclease signature motif containing protein [Cryobacterium sp. PH31-L1]|uniref:HNH endonuclease signature motif containing protein n=1 Tax=Cryobacterium sp. PH31-L1 TaxID=3046199 RepID=UPI0024B89615|nr:HNH endonuclease signature motif containing protein [Cryobacterium sp. PH31-L1]MDJ0378602.1 DUF222 domain-containing protein [Cryobacterium sp. PH31-L1]